MLDLQEVLLVSHDGASKPSHQGNSIVMSSNKLFQLFVIAAVALLFSCAHPKTFSQRWRLQSITVVLYYDPSTENDSSNSSGGCSMRQAIFLGAAVLLTQIARADTAVDRWVTSMGGRDRLAAVHSTYREATIQVAGHVGSIRIWRETDGKYRKEENIGTYSLIETFDGTRAMVKRGTEPAQELTDADSARVRSTAFANSSAIYFVAFPERRNGSVTFEGDDTVVLKPQGGIDWRVTLDPKTSLPQSMVHQEGDRTITVAFTEYETVGGIRFEKEIQRTMGGSGPNSVIRFTKTIVNPPTDATLFSIQDGQAVP